MRLSWSLRKQLLVQPLQVRRYEEEEMDKVKGMMFPGAGGGEDNSADGVPWWMKYLGKAAGITAAIVAMLFGVWCCITLDPMCLVAGIWQVAAGFIMIVIEAPFCCMFLDFVASFAEMVERRPPWQKTALYVVLAIPPLFLCFSLTTLVGCAGIAATGVLYGMQVIGKKANANDMAAAARGGEPDEKNIMDDGDWQTNP